MRDFTFNCGTWARLEIRDSVRPSLSKSVSALPPELENGITAMDSIWEAALDLLRQNQVPAAATITRAAIAAAIQYLRDWLAAGDCAVVERAESKPPLCPSTERTDEAGAREIADPGWIEEAEGMGATGVDPEDDVIVGVAELTAEVLPESISRFRRFRSARISEATW